MTSCFHRLLCFSAIALVLTATRPGFAAVDAGVSWLSGENAAQRDARTAWFREAKFGMFIHWGIYSIPARGEWYMRSAKIPLAEYSNYAAQFNPAKFDADLWAALAHDAGMKYMVLTAKHHDGFAMFKSSASAYNIVDATPFKRDVVKELADACPKHGIRFGTYYSFLADWGHKGGGAGGPHWDPPAQDGDLHEYIRKVAIPQIKELLTNYGPIAVMWFDGDGAKGIRPDESAEVIKLLKTQPQIVVDPRLETVKGDFASSEVDPPVLAPKGTWELCGSVTASWGFANHRAKPLSELLPYLITAWGMGGNVLLNVGPNAEGVIPEDSVNRLHEVGRWLDTYGESIYGSTAGPFDYVPWGTATRKGNTLFLQVFKWPNDGKLVVPLSTKVTNAILLGTAGPVKLLTSHDDPNRLFVRLPSEPPHPVANVVALTLDEAPMTNFQSVLRNVVVKASAAQGSASNAVDDDPNTRWFDPETKGWLEFNLVKPVTVATLRLGAPYCKVNNFALEYKDGSIWKPILQNEKAGDTATVKEFAPVTAQSFRISFLEAGKPVQVRSVELYPPL